LSPKLKLESKQAMVMKEKEKLMPIISKDSGMSRIK